MKFFLALVLSAFYTISFSQALEGTWQGTYELNGHDFPITLHVQLVDSAYEVHTLSFRHARYTNQKGKTFIKDTVVVRSVYYQKLGSDSFYLNELKQVLPFLADDRTHDQMQMFLKLKPEGVDLVLDGRWYYAEFRKGGRITVKKNKG